MTVDDVIQFTKQRHSNDCIIIHWSEQTHRYKHKVNVSVEGVASLTKVCYTVVFATEYFITVCYIFFVVIVAVTISL